MSPAARNDLRDIVTYYQQRQTGLDRRFLAALVDTLGIVVERPASFPEVFANVRRARLNRFPYGIFFQISNSTIHVIAVMHLHRDPRAWQRRI